jgi:hypothetical protein
MKNIKVFHSTLDEHAVSDTNCNDWYHRIKDNDTVYFATAIQLNELRIGVMLKEIKPFSIMFNDINIHIGSDGKLSDWPDDFGDHLMKQMFILIRKAKTKKADLIEKVVTRL